MEVTGSLVYNFPAEILLTWTTYMLKIQSVNKIGSSKDSPLITLVTSRAPNAPQSGRITVPTESVQPITDVTIS